MKPHSDEEQILEEERVFHIARRIADSFARQAYLDLACSDNEQLRQRIESLLSSHEDRDDVFLRPSDDRRLNAQGENELAMCTGAKIGKYTLIEELGEGGFGVVWAAQEESPHKKTVALKIIKRGMDSRQVVARFEAERNALSLMDHSNVAKVLDAGKTADGRSYFIMEYVPGIPITSYCDQNRLGVSDRLSLLAQVCGAVQHAHQKGIIHRDLKPGNILVARAGSSPICKVIDFGVAKAISQQLTERTFQTAFGQIVGTLQYMSPEQAQLHAMDVDTRSDVYSLGVVLFELLTGAPPISLDRIRHAPYAEALRLIIEVDAPRVSTRLGSLGDSLEIVAKHRNTDPKHLIQSTLGELDWIVVKALEKDRVRRYDTASSLAEDIKRFLNGEVVLARPPSATYRFSKLVGRNKKLFATVFAIASALLLATAISVWQAGKATQERNRTQQVLSELQSELIDKVHNQVMLGDEAKAREAIARAKLAGVSDERIQLYRGQLEFYFGRPADSYAICAPLSENSIAAHAISALAQLDMDDLAAFEQSVLSLKKRVAATPLLTAEDRLMAAQTILEHDPAFAKQLLEGVLQESDSALARLVHALVLASYAQETGDEQSARQALKDIEVAIVFAGESRLCLTAELDIKHIAYSLGIPVDEKLTERTLQRHLAELEDFPMGRGVLVRYLATVDSERAVALIHEWTNNAIPFGEFELQYYVPILLAHESPTTILEFIESLNFTSPYLQCSQARIMSLIPAKKAKARELCHRIIRDNPDFTIRTACLWTLLTLGDSKEVSKLSTELLETSRTPAYCSVQKLQLWAGQANPESFIQHSQQNRNSQHAAHFSLAARQLADGEWASGIGNLKESVRTRMFLQQDYWWATSILTAAEANRKWIQQTIFVKPTGQMEAQF